ELEEAGPPLLLVECVPELEVVSTPPEQPRSVTKAEVATSRVFRMGLVCPLHAITPRATSRHHRGRHARAGGGTPGTKARPVGIGRTGRTVGGRTRMMRRRGLARRARDARMAQSELARRRPLVDEMLYVDD